MILTTATFHPYYTHQMRATRTIAVHPEPAVEAFLVKLRSIARSESNPEGMTAETLAMNLGVSTSGVRQWIQGYQAPVRYALSALMAKLELIASVKPTAAPGFTTRPLPIPARKK